MRAARLARGERSSPAGQAGALSRGLSPDAVRRMMPSQDVAALTLQFGAEPVPARQCPRRGALLVDDPEVAGHAEAEPPPADVGVGMIGHAPDKARRVAHGDAPAVDQRRPIEFGWSGAVPVSGGLQVNEQPFETPDVVVETESGRDAPVRSDDEHDGEVRTAARDAEWLGGRSVSAGVWSGGSWRGRPSLMTAKR